MLYQGTHILVMHLNQNLQNMIFQLLFWLLVLNACKIQKQSCRTDSNLSIGTCKAPPEFKSYRIWIYLNQEALKKVFSCRINFIIFVTNYFKLASILVPRYLFDEKHDKIEQNLLIYSTLKYNTVSNQNNRAHLTVLDKNGLR